MGVYMKKIAVIGAGITGMSSAFTLANRGYDVTIYDKNRYAAMETSFANGGQLSPQTQKLDKMVNHFQRPEMDDEIRCASSCESETISS